MLLLQENTDLNFVTNFEHLFKLLSLLLFFTCNVL